jgi:hypothetical protein
MYNEHVAHQWKRKEGKWGGMKDRRGMLQRNETKLARGRDVKYIHGSEAYSKSITVLYYYISPFCCN